MTQLVTLASGLTPDQQAGADAFYNFLMSADPTFVISGGAGVGKTFLMSHLCKQVMAKYETTCKLLGINSEYDTLTFTATTNKAAEVLEKSLGLPVITIHSFLGLKVREDYKTGKTFLSKTSNWRVRKRQIVFIDESSMVDAALKRVIEESFQDSKIIYVGDHAQMAPVGEPDSPVFQNLAPHNFVYLAQPVRNVGAPALVNLCAQLRKTVETGVFHPIQEVPGVIDYLDDADMEHVLEHIFQEPDPSCRVLCYTNSRVEDYNNYIREEVQNKPSTYQVGDVLVTAQAYANSSLNSSRTLGVEREVEVLSISQVKSDYSFSDVFGNDNPILYREATVRCLSGGAGIFTVHIPESKSFIADGAKVYAKAKEWASYFALKGNYVDLRDRAACTVYKAQGSTYESVVIDLGNIGISYDAEQVARMLFVAASRATTRIFLYGRLPPAYIGKAIR